MKFCIGLMMVTVLGSSFKTISQHFQDIFFSNFTQNQWLNEKIYKFNTVLFFCKFHGHGVSKQHFIKNPNWLENNRSMIPFMRNLVKLYSLPISYVSLLHCVLLRTYFIAI